MQFALLIHGSISYFTEAYFLTKRLAYCHLNFNQPNVFPVHDPQIASTTSTALYVGQSQGGFLLSPLRGPSKYNIGRGRGGVVLGT